jgi:hypothetical protein
MVPCVLADGWPNVSRKSSLMITLPKTRGRWLVGMYERGLAERLILVVSVEDQNGGGGTIGVSEVLSLDRHVHAYIEIQTVRASPLPPRYFRGMAKAYCSRMNDKSREANQQNFRRSRCGSPPSARAASKYIPAHVLFMQRDGTRHKTAIRQAK